VNPTDSGDPQLALESSDLHLWLCHRRAPAGTDLFRRQVLSRYAPLAPGEWRFCRGPHGKPAVVDPPRPLAFNLSDSGEWRVCAVTGGGAVGVDLERCAAWRDPMRLARRFYRPGEVRALESAPAEQRLALFYALWTLKEARVKRHGEALGPSLATAGFALHGLGRAAPGRIEERHPDPGSPARYCLLEPLPGYRLAACWTPGAAARTRLSLFDWPPRNAQPGWRPILLATSHPLAMTPAGG
jgi:4'-phosphopantetheinyl transferase